MALSRKRKKELARLRDTASDLWDDQKELLEHAARVVRDATSHAGAVGREELSSRLHDGYGSATGAARERLNKDVLPGVASALASAIAVLDVAKDPRVRSALKRAGSTGRDLGSRAGITPARSSSGPGRYILIGLGLVAAAGIAYAAWQTLRADDELWVSDDSDDLEADTAG